MKLADLRRLYVDEERAIPAAIEADLALDPRPGARAILAAIAKRRRANRAEGQRLRKILRFEQSLWLRGVTLVAGCDEAGMSPLAGPVAAAAVIFPKDTRLPGVDDSKKLDAKERERLAPIIRHHAVAWCVAFVEPEEIDRINIYWAGILAMRRAITGLSPLPEHVLLDARSIRDLDLPQTRIVRGDSLSLSIAAASILAKTSRDAKMVELDRLHPGYGFAKHKGYPVKEHVEALSRLGVTPAHRRSFEPVRLALGLPPRSLQEPRRPRRRVR